MKIRKLKALAPFKGYVVTELSFEEVSCQIKLNFDKRCGPRCPKCASRLPRNKTGQRIVMDSPMAHGPITYLSFPTVQGVCPHCLCYVTTCPAEVHPSAQATWRFMRLVSSLASVAANTDVAALLDISDSTVRRYDKIVLSMDTPPPCLDGIRTLLIDEKSVRKKHNYVTVILNGDTGELLHMAEGKKKESVTSFLEKLSLSQKTTIKAIGIDRAGSYQAAAKEHLPNADIVYDRFHLMMNVNEAINEVRRNQWRQADQQERQWLKGKRFLLIANRDKLDIDGQVELHRLLQANASLSCAHVLKEQFQSIFRYQRQGWAERALENWCALAEASRLKPFERLAKSFRKQAKRVCGYVKHKLTSGRIEGFNNQIARLIHRGCGIRDLDYLELKLRHQSIMRS